MVSTKAVASSDHRAAFALRCDRCAAQQRVSKSICHGEFPKGGNWAWLPNARGPDGLVNCYPAGYPVGPTGNVKEVTLALNA
jgi:hypothetical protein